jgi:hypothetical protein
VTHSQVLVGSDVSGNVASLFPEHPMCEHRVRNYESTWGAEGKFRDLLPTQVVLRVCACVCVGGGGVSKLRDKMPTQNVRSATCCQHGYACILSFFIIIFSLFLSFLSYFSQPAAKTGLHVFYYNCY